MSDCPNVVIYSECPRTLCVRSQPRLYSRARLRQLSEGELTLTRPLQGPDSAELESAELPACIYKARIRKATPHV